MGPVKFAGGTAHPRALNLAEFVDPRRDCFLWPDSQRPEARNRGGLYCKRSSRIRVHRLTTLPPPCVRVFWTTATLHAFTWEQRRLETGVPETRKRWVDAMRVMLLPAASLLHDEMDSLQTPWCVHLRVPAGTPPWQWWCPLGEIPSNLELRIDSLENRSCIAHLHLATWTDRRDSLSLPSKSGSVTRSWLLAEVESPGWIPRSVHLRLPPIAWKDLHRTHVF